jgi:hypothetical protein
VLGDVNGDIGHTIIHFLYTGRYESLYSGYDLAAEYRQGARTNEAPRRYDLCGVGSLLPLQVRINSVLTSFYFPFPFAIFAQVLD